MKKLFLVACIAFFIIGCGPKNKAISLNQYSTHSKITDKNIEKIYINSINDNREIKNYVATVKDRYGNIKEYINLNGNLEIWFKESLVKELYSRGISVIDSADTVVDINLTKFSGNLQGFSGENLSAEARLTINFKRWNNTIKKDVSQTQSKFTPLVNGGAFDSYLNDLLKDMVIRTAKQISLTIKQLNN
ncbi:hypothetical protein CBLAS_1475 [Campylobacter blaseri]|uniref:ABC-type transport auxiliary lipoprotein component domain-containing protein n=1 Tax=Campylobacter blaseri TaxID=2042961 RepID=A0A2P8QZ76_9BACT|nr:YajG family lipoprotein [Campylobacter blaseri]PSM51550.1 hypothetical protein CQ405_07070 [Campylobacter blaseri]PSM53343.1 hypothetical protein CRN67_07075 [Campylobacter blaseri]QKF86636.1 hypothetical protein CBLAS_1475 [Campylobacter blaseri]